MTAYCLWEYSDLELSLVHNSETIDFISQLQLENWAFESYFSLLAYVEFCMSKYGEQRVHRHCQYLLIEILLLHSHPVDYADL